MDGIITFCAKYLLAVSVLGIVFLFYRLDSVNRKKLAFLLVAGGVLSLVLSRLGHQLYNDPRPFISDGSQALFDSSRNNGFPSDHALLAAFLAFVALSFSKKMGFSLVVVAALVGWGRVAGHVHHLTDVIGSFVITAVAAYVVLQVINKMKKTPSGGKRLSS